MPSADYSFDVTRGRGGVVVTVHGELGPVGAIRLGAILGDLIEGQGNLAVGVDLRQVTGGDTAALGVVAVAARLASRRGGELSVAGAPRAPGPSEAVRVAGVHAHRHLVGFYDSDAILAHSVRDYLEPALRQDGAVIVVATRRHRDLFEAALVGAGVDVEKARDAAHYLDVDAEELLSRFMVDGTPDPIRFHTTVGDLIAGAAGPGRTVRIYGEMVAVLWAEGNLAAAIALEDLWNDLGSSQPFSLLCAYPTTAFDSLAATGLFRTICEQHSPPAPNVRR